MECMPAPPAGMLFPPAIKHEAFDNPNIQLRSGQKCRPPIERHRWYLCVLINEDGQPEVRSSPLLDCVSQEWLQPLSERLTQFYETQVSRSDEVLRAQAKGYRFDPNGSKSTIWPGQPQSIHAQYLSDGVNSHQVQANPKRRRVDSQLVESQDLRLSVPGLHESISPNRNLPYMEALGRGPGTLGNGESHGRVFLNIKVSDSTRWCAWFEDAFKAIQQQACRFIAKEWIKLIHPKKQSTHPYNGKLPRNQGGGEPDRTKPPYWPGEIRHKEPDHIDKISRTKLLVHILVRTPQPEITPANIDGRSGGKEIVAKDLLEVLKKKKDEYKDKWEIIEHVIHIRSQLENYEDGGLDDDAVLTVPNYQESTRPRSNDKKQRMKANESAIREPQEAVNEVQESPPASPTPPCSPIGSIATPAESENEDDISTVTVSFTSNISHDSSRSSGLVSSANPGGNLNQHVQMNMPATDQHQSMLLDTNPSGLDYDHPNNMHHGAPEVPNVWPTTTGTDSRLNSVYASDMLMSRQPVHPLVLTHSTQFEHDMYSAARSAGMNEMMPTLLPYSESQHYIFEYDRSMPYRDSTISQELVDHAGILHSQCYPIYNHSQPPPRH